MPLPQSAPIPTASVDLGALDQGALEDPDFEHLIKACVDGAPVHLELSYAGRTVRFAAPQVFEAAVDVARLYTPKSRGDIEDVGLVTVTQDPMFDAAVKKLGELVGA